MNLTQCKGCKEYLVKSITGTFAKNNKRYTDELGRLWNGKLCPKCNTLRLKLHMRNKRCPTPA